MTDTRRTARSSNRHWCRSAAASRPRAGHERIEAARCVFRERAARAELRGGQAFVIDLMDPMPLHAALVEELLFPAHAGAAAAEGGANETTPGVAAAPAAATRLRRRGRPWRRSTRLIDMFL
jgi:hypothetical protein